MAEPVPPALVLGCNTPDAIGVLSDWFEEQTGHATDFAGAGWSDLSASVNNNRSGYPPGMLRGDADGVGHGVGYGHHSGNGDGSGSGHLFGYAFLSFGSGFGDGICFDYGLQTGDGHGFGDGNRDGAGRNDT